MKYKISKTTHIDTNYINCINLLVRELIIHGDLEEAVIYNSIVVQKSTAIHYDKGKGVGYLRFGIIYEIKGDYEKALKNNFYILSHFKNDLILVNKAIGNIASVHYNQGNNTKALEYNLLALRTNERLNNQDGLYVTLLNIGNIYNTSNSDKKAMSYYQKALVIAEELQDSLKICSTYAVIGLIYNHYKMYSKAIYHENVALIISRKLRDKRLQSSSYANLATIYKAQNKLDSAFYFNKLELKVAKSLGDKLHEASSLVNIGDYYLSKKKYTKAKNTLMKALNLSKETEDLEGLRIVYERLSKFYQAIKNPVEALGYYKLFVKARDSLYNETNIKKAIQSEINYEYDKKILASKLEQEKKISDIELKNVRKNSIKNIVLTMTIALLLIGSAIGYVVYRNNKQKQVIREFEKNELKQKFLVSQMNPHFIFNSIDNIQSLIGKRDDEAKIYLQRFAKLTRQILEYSRETQISIEDEIQLIENYMSIQQLLFDNKFSYELLIDGSIEAGAFLIPPMLTQPFIENAIKHGLKGKINGGKIWLKFYLKEQKLFFEIKDNGTGFILEKTGEHKSLAMKITNERFGDLAEKIITENRYNDLNEIVGAKILFEIPYIYEN
ncbi:MAG: tetratricopeptide repeat protein [Bacteroidetes bacterium]|nr:tetratricopeptide repeat protein [Bacteroidota bacterium]